MPKSIGGPETDPVAAFRAVEELSKVDGSVGWCSFVATAISMYSAWILAKLACDLFGQPLDIRTAVFYSTPAYQPATPLYSRSSTAPIMSRRI